MSENNFQQINQNQYRGSRYSSFVGGGADSAGNVTPAYSENSANTVASNDPNLQQGTVNPNSNVNGSLLGNTSITNPVLKGTSAGLTGSALQYAAPTIGARVGLNLGIGNGIENAFNGVGSDIASRISSGLSRVSGGLIGNAGSSTVPDAIGRLSSSLSGAPAGTAASNLSGSLSKASSGASFGGAAGSGIASAAVTLLTGGSLKDAAFAGLGSYFGSMAGTAAGAAIGGTIGSVVPVVGTIIGSWLGSRLGGLFGGDKDYPYGRADINIVDGKATPTYTTLDGFKDSDIQSLGNATSSIIQKFIDATGSKNVTGAKGTIGYQVARNKNHKLNQSGYFAGGIGDFNGGATYQGLKDPKNAVESSVKDWLKGAVFSDTPDRQNIIQSGLTNNFSLDDIYNSLTGTYNSPTIYKPRQATFYS